MKRVLVDLNTISLATVLLKMSQILSIPVIHARKYLMMSSHEIVDFIPI